MLTLLHALFISFVQIALMGLAGLGIARLFLPKPFHHHELTLAPVFGLALLAILGYYGANIGFTMRQIVPMVLVLALILLIISRFVKQPSLDVSDEESSEPIKVNRWLPGMLPWYELVPLLLIMAVTWGINIAPTINYGTLMPIGHNWDVEFYLPLSDYLQDYSYKTLDQAPANPLRDLLLTDRLASRAMGATYVQSMVDTIIFGEAWHSFVPMLAVLRVLGLASLYALLRVGIQMPPIGSLVGVALVGINSLLLWTTYNSFGMSIGGLVVLPAAILFTQLSLLGGLHTIRYTLLSAFLVAGLTCIYWPLLMAYGAASLGIGIAVLWMVQRKDWIVVIVRGMLILLMGGMLGILVHIRAMAAFVWTFVVQTPSMNVTDFIAPTVIAGTAPFSHQGFPPFSLLETILQWTGLALFVLFLFVGYSLSVKRQRTTIGMIVCVLLYLIGLRFVVGFPYGFLRGASYVNILLIGIVGGAATNLVTIRQTRQGKNSSRVMVSFAHVPILLSLVFFGVSIKATYTTYQQYADHPGAFGAETATMRDALLSMSQPWGVYISPAPELRGPYMGAVAYTLQEYDLFGVMQTGYQSLVNMPKDETPAYYLLHQSEDPRSYGLSDDDEIWHDGRAVFYATPPKQVTFISGRPSWQNEGNYLADDTTYTRAQIGTGSYVYGKPDQPLQLTITGNSLAYATDVATMTAKSALAILAIDDDTSQVTRSFQCALASFNVQEIDINIGGKKQSLEIPAGLVQYESTRFHADTPNTVSISGQEEPVFLRWAATNKPFEEIDASAKLEPITDTILIGLSSTAQEQGVGTEIQVANPGNHQLRLAVEIYEEVAGYATQPTHYAWSIFAMPPQGKAHLDLDLQTPAILFNNTELDVTIGDIRDGAYFASLWVYQGEQVRHIIPFLRFQRTGGSIEQITPLDVNVAFARVKQPAESIMADFTGGIQLQGFEFDTTHVTPDQETRVSLLWQALQPQPASPYLVFVQILDEQNNKIAEWNGAAGGDWYPTPAWQPDEQIWQDIPLTINADATPGTYRIITGVFDPATGQRLALPDGSDMLLLGELHVDR